MEDEQRYAYGSDEVDDRVCPATAAGVSTHDGFVSGIAGRYDEQLRTGYKGFDEGTATNEQARSAWLAAIDEAQQAGNSHEVKAGKEIAERLWDVE
jgi:hypothetical protein